MLLCGAASYCRFPAGLKSHDFQGLFGYKVGALAVCVCVLLLVLLVHT